MIEPVDMPNMRERFDRLQSRHSGGASGPPGGEMEHRVGTLEKAIEKIDKQLEKLVDGQAIVRERLASIDAKLDSKGSAIELAEIKGRVNSLPTTWQMITLIVGTVFTILGGSFLILKFGLPRAP